jgi:glycerol-3-phosphate dehydrogenase
MKKRTVETQVAIIGGGIAGTAIARELSKYKVDICLLEKESNVGWGITKGSMALIHGGIAYLSSRIIKRMESDLSLEAFLSQPLNIKERLGETGRKMYFELASLLNATITRPGRVMVAADREQLEMYKVIKAVAEANGVKDVVILDRDGLLEKEPLINPKFVGGIYDPSEAAIFPPEWVTAFAENAKDNGVHILLDTEVKAIEECKGYYFIKTNNGSIKAEFVVNAAGLFADEIAGMIGKPDFSMFFYKCQMLVLENKGYIRHVVARLPEPGRPRMLIPTTHGDLLVVHTMDPCTDKYDLGTTKEGLDLVSTYPLDLIPNISPRKDIKASFAGFLAFNTKKLPDYLLEFPKERFLNVALAAPGLGPAPALAREVMRMLADEGLELVEKSDFNPYRFTEPRFIELPTEEKNEKIRENPRYGHIICRCEHVSEQEVAEAIRAGARTLDGVKFRTRAGMGRCQGGFCTSRVLQIMARELNVSPLELTKKGGSSYILKCETKELNKEKEYAY